MCCGALVLVVEPIIAQFICKVAIAAVAVNVGVVIVHTAFGVIIVCGVIVNAVVIVVIAVENLHFKFL